MLSRLTRAHQEHSNVATILPSRRGWVGVEDRRTLAPRMGSSKNCHVAGIATTLLASELTLLRRASRCELTRQSTLSARNSAAVTSSRMIRMMSVG